jgi:hypothetical protein
MHDPNESDPTDTEPTESGATAGEAFIERWSRRKSKVRQGLSVEPEPAAAALDSAAPVEAPLPPPVELTDSDMPALETLDERSDYSGFLSPKVTENLRRRALRKLFHLPGFNVRDGLDDYDEDFTVFEPLGDVVTADMRHRLEQEAERAKEALQQEQTAGGDGPSEDEPSEVVAESSDEQALAGEEPDTRSKQVRPSSQAEQEYEA